MTLIACSRQLGTVKRMDYSAYQFIKAERSGRILRLTLTNPPMNTVQMELHNELSRIFHDVQVDHESDVIILTGAGEVFSAGGDIPNMQRRIDDPELFNRKNVEMKRIIFGLIELEKPIICRINGDCMGLGATLALLCDLIVAVDSARIADPHVKMGYVAGDGGAIIWPQLIGFARAKQYLLLGDPITAPEAERIGLVNFSVPQAELDAKVDQLAQRLVSGATKAIRWTKTSMNIQLRQLAHTLLDASLAYEALTNVSADHQEAVTAFKEKRRPVFTGK
jgi:enoyl-CoA hydratase